MIDIKYIKLFLLFIFVLFLHLFSAKAQTVTIWEENFTYPNGTTTETKDGITWTASGTQGNKGIQVNNNELDGRGTNHKNNDTWITENPINISGYVDISISVDVSSSDNLGSNDNIQVKYSLDGGTTWTLFEYNGYLEGNISETVSASQTGLSGSSLLLVIKMYNDSQHKHYYADNIVVTGLTPSDPPNCSDPVWPGNGDSDVSVNTNLIWNSDRYATDYYLYLGTNSPPTDLVNGSSFSTTYYTPSTELNTNTTYYWKVVPYNAVGSASGCSVWSFTTGTKAEEDTTFQQLFNNGEDLVFSFPFTGCAIIADALLTVTVQGDIKNKYYNIYSENGLVGQVGPTGSGSGNCVMETVSYTIDVADIQDFASDGEIIFTARPQNGIKEKCPDYDPSYVEMNLKYSYATIPACFIYAPTSASKNEQNISISGPNGMSSYSWNITSGDAVIYGSGTTENILVNAGVSDFTVELVIENYLGCSSTCSVNVSVQTDTEDPQITCPANVNVLTDAGLCTASGVDLGTPVTSDNGKVASVVNDAVEPYAIGDNIVTWTVTDDAGNTATCEQTVKVEPDEIIDIQVVDLENDCQSGKTGSQTTVTWDISKLAGYANWSFDYTINDGTSDVASGTQSGLTGSATQVSFDMDNSTGADQTFTLIITNVQDECTTEQNITNNTDSVILWGVPDTGVIKPD